MFELVLPTLLSAWNRSGNYWSCQGQTNCMGSTSPVADTAWGLYTYMLIPYLF